MLSEEDKVFDTLDSIVKLSLSVPERDSIALDYIYRLDVPMREEYKLSLFRGYYFRKMKEDKQK